MRRDETASKCFVQLVGNRKLVGDKALELPSLPVSEIMSFKTMPDYGAGPGLAVHTLHFTEYASRLPAVLILPITACSGVPGLAP